MNQVSLGEKRETPTGAERGEENSCAGFKLETRGSNVSMCWCVSECVEVPVCMWEHVCFLGSVQNKGSQ